VSAPFPSSTVMLLRDSPGHGVEALLVRRNSKLTTGGGAWVFPGGRVDRTDYGDPDDHFLAAQNAAIRETLEETGVSLHREELTAFAHWTTPPGAARRFATWFFLAHAREAVDIRVDGGEIVDYAWYSPQAALDEQRAGRITMMPPTFVCLSLLAEYQDCLAAVAGFRSREVQHFNPLILKTSKGQIILYDDDAGYATGNPETPGRRHRILIAGNRWEYQNCL
jgi:8-oxo-dGTP pyrophosphatase MutT (NUDIX family)